MVKRWMKSTTPAHRWGKLEILFWNCALRDGEGTRVGHRCLDLGCECLLTNHALRGPRIWCRSPQKWSGDEKSR